MKYYIYLLDKGSNIDVSVANSKEEFKNMRVEELELKINVFICPSLPCPLLYKGKRLDRNRTLGSYGIKHKDVICKEYRNSDQDLYGITILRPCKRRYPPPVDEHVGAKQKDEVEIIPRSCSMDNLLCDMQQPH